MNMPRKIRSLQEAPPIRAEIDLVGLYEELSPPWMVGSADPMSPAGWDRAIFVHRGRSYASDEHRAKHNLKPAA